jgi:hypothetical protein
MSFVMTMMTRRWWRRGRRMTDMPTNNYRSFNDMNRWIIDWLCHDNRLRSHNDRLTGYSRSNHYRGGCR